MNPIAAEPEEREGVARVLRLLRSNQVEEPAAASYQLTSPSGEVTELPVRVVLLLQRMIEVLASGDAITVVPVDKELTTQQAANVLNVSRQYVVRLLDDGRIPFRRTGTHRRVRMEDLIAYKRQRDQDRMAALDDLTQLTEEFGGYEELPERD